MLNVIVGNSEKTTISTYKEFVRLSPVPVTVLDVNLNYIACSSKWVSLVNLSDTNVQNQCLFHSFFNTNQSFKSKCFDSLNGVVYQDQEGLFFNGSTTFRWIVYHMHPLRDDKGEICALVIYADDITSQKLLSQEQKENQTVRDIDIEDSSLGIICFDLQGNCIDANLNAKELLGYTDSELTTDFVKKILFQEDKRAISNNIQQLIKNPKKHYAVVEQRLVDASNKVLNGILFISIRNDKKGKPSYFEAQIVDVYSKTTSNELHPAFMDMEAIFKASTNIVIVLTDENGIIREFNEGAERILGYTKEEMIGKCSPEVFHCEEELGLRSTALSKKLGKKISGFSLFKELAKSDYRTEEWIYKHKNGSCFPASLTLNTVENASGEIVGYLGVAQDISILKHKELEIEKLLGVSEKQREKLLNFTHIVSHNIKSHSSNITMLLDDYYESAVSNEFSETADLLSQTSEKLSETIHFLNQILSINSIPKSDLKMVNLYERIHFSVEKYKTLALDNKVSVITEIDKDINLLATSTLVDNIIDVFLENAILYSKEAEDSFVHLKAEEKEEYLVLQVKDNGLGINLKLHGEKLFGMYNTFHNHSKSRGLGLFVAKNQIEALGGKVKVNSKQGVGSTFKIYFKYEKN